MTTRSLLLATVALAISSATLGQALDRPTATPPAPASEQTLLAELAEGMRELIEAVVPEISLPALELKLPTLDAELR